MTQQTASSLADYYTNPSPPYGLFPHELRFAKHETLTLLHTEQDTHFGSQAPRRDIAIVCARQSASTVLRYDVGDGWTPEYTIRSGDLFVLPAFSDQSFDARGAHSLEIVTLDANITASLLEEHRAGDMEAFHPLTAAVGFRDGTIRHAIATMWAESARNGGASDLLMDGLTQVLIARLLDKAGALRRPQIVLPLSEAELTRLDEMIAARIAERLTVEDLAQILDMPRWTFADAFKATTGDTPHAYVTGKRVERACELLRIGDMPLAEIAYATGFASQSHMTDTFRRVLGTTPGKWRAEVRAP